MLAVVMVLLLNFFTDHGRVITATDYGKSVHFENTMAQNVIIGDFNEIDFETQFDTLWCSHVLEHQLDVQRFLLRINSLIREGGSAGNYSSSNETGDSWSTCFLVESWIVAA